MNQDATDQVEMELPEEDNGPGARNGGDASSKVPNVKLRRFYGDERKYKDWRAEMMTTKFMKSTKSMLSTKNFKWCSLPIFLIH